MTRKMIQNHSLSCRIVVNEPVATSKQQHNLYVLLDEPEVFERQHPVIIQEERKSKTEQELNRFISGLIDETLK